MSVLAFDTETYLITPYHQAPKIVCLSWAFERDSGIVVGHDEIEKWLHQAFDSKALMVGQYVAYDTTVILANFPNLWIKVWEAYHEDRITCTAIREKLLDIAIGEFKKPKKGHNPYSLKEMIQRNFSTEIEKGEDTWRLRYSELDSIPLSDWPKEAIEYSIDDSVATLALYEHQEIQKTRIQYSMPTEYEDVRADFALRLTSCWGIEVDQPRVEELSNKIVSEMESLTEYLIKDGIALPNKKGGIKKSLDSIREIIKATFQGTEIPRTPKGAIQTSAEVLEECDSGVLKQLLKYNKLQKLNSTYISKLVDVSIIHPNLYGIGAESDRTSASNPNIQNYPRKPGPRECFKARNGRTFLSCDFDSQEMRTLAQTCLDIVGDSKLANRFQKDIHFDPHLEFAATLGNIPNAKELYDSGDKKIKELRQQTKIANFGLPGGLGAKTFVHYAKGWGIDITFERAQMLKNAWLQQWPEMDMYFKHVSSLVGQANYGIQTIPQSGFRRAGVAYTDCCNGYFQTLAAHASKRALFEVCKHAYMNERSPLYGSRPVLFIHDEIIMETPKEIAHEAAQEIEQLMIEAMDHYTPDIPVAASSTLMLNWSKEAKRVTDSEGRLIPWTL